VHGAEAVLPADVRFEAPWVIAYNDITYFQALQDIVDLVDEARDIALARTAVHQQAIRNYHSQRLRTRSFNKGDLVLRLIQKGHLKLEYPWEGPYVITEVMLGGAYRIRNTTIGLVEGNPWNILRSCDDSMFRIFPSFTSFNKDS
jgi:hypothetical protein